MALAGIANSRLNVTKKLSVLTLYSHWVGFGIIKSLFCSSAHAVTSISCEIYQIVTNPAHRPLDQLGLNSS